MITMSSQCIRRIARLTLAVLFAAVVPDPPALAEGAASDKIELPPYKGTLKDDYYPADARLHNLQGRALVEFALNGRGVPTHVALVSSEPAHRFDDSALLLVRNLRFEVPAGWEQSAAAAHRFQLGVRFQEVECLNLSKCEAEPRNPPADYDAAMRTYIVTAQRHVVSLDSKPPAPPAPRARPRASPAASPEPNYPPG
jgi:TonB family protein